MASQAAYLEVVLGLTEDELCQICGVTPLGLIAGEADLLQPVLVLKQLLESAEEQISQAVLKRWLRMNGSYGRPLELLLAHDFAGFELALEDLLQNGFRITG